MSEAPATFLDGRVTLHAGDCLEVLAGLPEASVDAVVTDPPYHLTSIVKRFGGANAAPARSAGATGVYGRASKGFMGQQWDGGDIAFRPETWTAVLRVLKPGGHLVAFSAPRCVHRMGVAIEDAGFEIRDRLVEFVAADAAVRAFIDTLSDAQADAFLECIERSGFGGELAWVFGSGFPKSHDISKAIDKALGAEREKVRTPMTPSGSVWMDGIGSKRPWKEKAKETGYHEHDGDEPATAAAAFWRGWGTALKPAYEPIIMARRPLAEPSVARQVLATGTGGINVGATAIGTEGGSRTVVGDRKNTTVHALGDGLGAQGGSIEPAGKGRWPANVLHDGSDEVVAEFPESEGQQRPVTGAERAHGTVNAYGDFNGARHGMDPRADSGSAARFFYSSKAGGDDRLGSKHPTVKPVDLMQWLVRLVCPKGGTVLDPFAGTGTTGEAAFREGMKAVLIEREAEYRADIARRMGLALAGNASRKAASAQARGLVPGIEETALFGGIDADEGGGQAGTSGTDDRAGRAQAMNEAER